ncbi:MAG: hypothetical protein WCK49_01430 [Myxococcaceae bacterium]
MDVLKASPVEKYKPENWLTQKTVSAHLDSFEDPFHIEDHTDLLRYSLHTGDIKGSIQVLRRLNKIPGGKQAALVLIKNLEPDVMVKKAHKAAVCALLGDAEGLKSVGDLDAKIAGESTLALACEGGDLDTIEKAVYEVGSDFFKKSGFTGKAPIDYLSMGATAKEKFERYQRVFDICFYVSNSENKIKAARYLNSLPGGREYIENKLSVPVRYSRRTSRQIEAESDKNDRGAIIAFLKNPVPDRSEQLEEYAQEWKDTFNPKDISNEAINKGKFIVEHVGTTFLDKLPFINILVGMFSKARTRARIETTVDHFDRFNKVRLQTLSMETQKINDRRKLDFPRGVDPVEYQKNEGVNPNLLLANTCEYAQNQLKRRYEKLKVRDFANDLQLMGGVVGLTGVAAPVGMGLTIANWSIKAGVSGRSLGTFLKKLWNGKLGIERTRHAKVLFDLAKQHLENDQEKLSEDSKVASKKAYELLQGLGIISENPGKNDVKQFVASGLKRIKIALRT